MRALDALTEFERSIDRESRPRSLPRRVGRLLAALRWACERSEWDEALAEAARLWGLEPPIQVIGDVGCGTRTRRALAC